MESQDNGVSPWDCLKGGLVMTLGLDVLSAGIMIQGGHVPSFWSLLCLNALFFIFGCSVEPMMVSDAVPHHTYFNWTVEQRRAFIARGGKVSASDKGTYI